MIRSLKAILHVCQGLILALTLLVSSPVLAEDDVNQPLPPAVVSMAKKDLARVGIGTYRKYGFSVYRASLWAPGGHYDAKNMFALELRYVRSVSQETLIETVIDNIREQNIADDATLTKWQAILQKSLPAVEDGDVLIGLSIPGKTAALFFNGKEITQITDPQFSQAFFNIWLGDTANENLRNKLLAINP